MSRIPSIWAGSLSGTVPFIISASMCAWRTSSTTFRCAARGNRSNASALLGQSPFFVGALTTTRAKQCGAADGLWCEPFPAPGAFRRFRTGRFHHVFHHVTEYVMKPAAGKAGAIPSPPASMHRHGSNTVVPSSVSPEGPERKWGSLWWCRTSRSNHWSRSKARGEHLYVSASVTDAPSIVRTVRLPGVQALTPRSPREAGSSASGASGN